MITVVFACCIGCGVCICSFARCFGLLALIAWFVVRLVAIGLLIVLFSLLCDLMFCDCCFTDRVMLLFVIVAFRVCWFVIGVADLFYVL